MKNVLSFAVIGFCLAFFVPNVVRARPADSFVFRSFTSWTLTIPYRLFIPKNYTDTIKYPMVCTFHGGDAFGTDDTAQITDNRLAEVWAEDTNQARHPCFVYSPQIPSPAQSFPYVYMNGGNGYDYHTTPEAWMEQNVIACIDSLKREFSIDTNRIYVTGLSLGGWGTWDLITRFPTRFAGAIPVSGGGDSSEIERIRRVPVWDFHGALDTMVPTSNSREMMAAYEAHGIAVVRYTCNLDGSAANMTRAQLDQKVFNGANILYTEYQDEAHGPFDVGYDDSLLPVWLFSKSKTTAAVRHDIAARPFDNAGSQSGRTFPSFDAPAALARALASAGTADIYNVKGELLWHLQAGTTTRTGIAGLGRQMLLVKIR